VAFLLFFLPNDGGLSDLLGESLNLGRIDENFLNDFLLDGNLNTDLSLGRIYENLLDDFLLSDLLNGLIDLLDGSLNDFLLNGSLSDLLDGLGDGNLTFDSLGFGGQIFCLNAEFLGSILITIGAEFSCLSAEFFCLSTEGL